MLKKITIFITVLVIGLLSGCGSKAQIVRSPETDMLITGYEWGKLRVSACHEGEIIDAGYIDCSDLEGWTLTIFEDWDKYCK